MFSFRFLLFVAVAIACACAAEERVKKQVLLGASPYAYSAYASPYAAYSAPLAYSAPAAAIPAFGYGYHGLYY
ncbi:Hypothetical protein NTJ_08224 [Nesidiocoris tenuis]|uniref:Uncharacterized protein n=1 Tax=Nesidiocoris tenuis TaxID=355587 RepID=A0ABN7AWS8_9HEMI|nr:Hypothetical protein NTJ_08224 [Nesidiocoris tenuis]